MGQRVNRVKTQVSEPQMAQAIIAAWRELFHTVPTKQQVNLILAQNAFETGHRKSMYNYNVGNITTNGKGPFNFYDDLTTKEQVNRGVWKSMNLKYRAYPSLKDGVKDYLNFLSGKNYSQAWQHILHPNPAAFSKALKNSGYYTADEKPYTEGLTRLYSQIGKSNSYELARNNQVVPLRPAKPAGGFINNVENLLDHFLKQVAAMDNKKLYKKYLPHHKATVAVSASDRTNAIEFARILSLALNEELGATASIHGEDQIEVECTIAGPEKECFAAVEQLSNSVAEVFQESTSKFGGISIKTKLFTNKTSSYQLVDISKLEVEHRKFLLKMVQG